MIKLIVGSTGSGKTKKLKELCEKALVEDKKVLWIAEEYDPFRFVQVDNLKYAKGLSVKKIREDNDIEDIIACIAAGCYDLILIDAPTKTFLELGRLNAFCLIGTYVCVQANVKHYKEPLQIVNYEDFAWKCWS